MFDKDLPGRERCVSVYVYPREFDPSLAPDVFDGIATPREQSTGANMERFGIPCPSADPGRDVAVNVVP